VTAVLRRSWGGFRHESWIYFGSCLVMLTPGLTPPYVSSHSITPGDVTGWPSDDQQRIVDEARRQLDQQRAELDRIQNRSQFLFTTGLGVLALAAFAQRTVHASRSALAWTFWVVGVLLMVLGVWGPPQTS
jgi:hypothetical protein